MKAITTNIDKTIEILQNIKAIDEKIKQIEAMAMLASEHSDNNLSAKIGLSVKNLNKKEKVQKDSYEGMSETGNSFLDSLRQQIENMGGRVNIQKISTNNNDHIVYDHKLSNNSLLKVLSIVIEDLNKQREELIKQSQEL